VLRLDDVARPGIGDEDVLVQVVAAGVDRGALHFMTGRPYLMRLGTGLRTPKVTAPGVSIAGRVEAVESQVARFAAGDGAARGTYAEYVAAPQRKVAAKPPRLSFEEAAVLVSGCSSVPAFCRTASSVLRSLQPGRAGAARHRPWAHNRQASRRAERRQHQHRLPVRRGTTFTVTLTSAPVA
jgi:NADPH:quinone reductase-like Zn-dependent oxidoreductase